MDLWISTIFTRIVGFLPKEHSETQTPESFYQIYQVISKYFNGNSDNFHSLNFSPKKYWRTYFFNERGNRWTIGETGQLAEFWNMDISRIYPVKVPKPRYPSHTNSRDKESLNSSTQAKPC